jgi:hypothetical protein
LRYTQIAQIGPREQRHLLVCLRFTCTGVLFLTKDMATAFFAPFVHNLRTRAHTNYDVKQSVSLDYKSGRKLVQRPLATKASAVAR